MANAQDKPPLINTTLGPGYGQTPSPPAWVPPSPPGVGQVPPPPAQEMVPPPPGGPLPGVQQIIPANAANAVSTAKKAKTYLNSGKVWVITGPRGELEVKAAITYDGIAVAVLHFDAKNGTLLPLGVHPISVGVAPPLETVKRTLPSIISKIEVLNGAEYIEPENVWAVPLSYDGMIVAHLKIYGDGIHIVPDYPANQEMQSYGR